ncbi:MAG: histidinol-phosphate transaminase [Thermofilum sp.]
MIRVSRRGGYVRLNMNESPYPPPPLAVEMAKRYASHMNLYEVEHLREELLEELSRYAGVSRRSIDLFAGSSEAISIMLSLARASGVDVVLPHPTFFVVYELARAHGVRLLPVQLSGEEFELRAEELARRAGGRLVYLANPNNPTGNLLVEDAALVARLAARAKYLFLDEAYYEFSGTTFCSDAVELGNVAVLRSLSKAFSLAGARVGYVVASPEMLRALNSFRIGFEVPVISQAAALGALRSRSYASRVVEEVSKTREWFREKLLELGIPTPESRTNFVLAKLPTSCVKVQRRLRRMGFLVMCFDGVPELRRFRQYMRITVGRRDQMEAFLEAFRRALGKEI